MMRDERIEAQVYPGNAKKRQCWCRATITAAMRFSTEKAFY
jgi:hypothetical protein